MKAEADKHWRIMVSSTSGSIAILPEEQKDIAIAVTLSLGVKKGPVAGSSGVW